MAELKILVWNVMNLSSWNSNGTQPGGNVLARAELYGEAIAYMNAADSPDIIFLLETGVSGETVGKRISDTYFFFTNGNQRKYAVMMSPEVCTYNQRLETIVMLFDKGLQSKHNDKVLNALNLPWKIDDIYINTFTRIARADPDLYRGAWILDLQLPTIGKIQLRVMHGPFENNLGTVDVSMAPYAGLTNAAGTLITPDVLPRIKIAVQAGTEPPFGECLFMGDFNVNEVSNDAFRTVLFRSLPGHPPLPLYDKWGPQDAGRNAMKTSLKSMFNILDNLTVNDYALSNPYDQGFATPKIDAICNRAPPEFHDASGNPNPKHNSFHTGWANNTTNTEAWLKTLLETQLPAKLIGTRGGTKAALSPETINDADDPELPYVQAFNNMITFRDPLGSASTTQPAKKPKLSQATFKENFDTAFDRLNEYYADGNLPTVTFPPGTGKATLNVRLKERFFPIYKSLATLLKRYQSMTGVAFPNVGEARYYAFYLDTLSDHLPVLHTIKNI